MQELWRPVVGYEGLYEVSDQGRVKSLPRRRRNGGIIKERILRTAGNPYQLATFTVDRKRTAKRVHQLVAEAFLGPAPSGMIVLHGPGGKGDNRLENLSYGTYSDNNKRDRWRDGTINAGEAHHKTTITAKDVLEIRALAGTMPQKDIGQLYGLTQAGVSGIICRRRWAHLSVQER